MKKELQSLLSLLIYVAKCIKYARYFFNRMLMLLRENTHCSRIRITEDFKKDLRWFNAFLPVFNGVSFFKQPPSKSVHLDACPSGLGAIFDHQVHSLPLPSNWRDLNIAYTELVNILVALKVWHVQWEGSSLLIRCDNQAVVSVLTTGKTREPVMAKYTRNIFLWLSAFIYLGFYVAFNTVQVISRRVVERAEETSTYSSLGFCTVNCRPMASNYQLSHLRP